MLCVLISGFDFSCIIDQVDTKPPFRHLFIPEYLGFLPSQYFEIIEFGLIFFTEDISGGAYLLMLLFIF